MTHNDVVLGTEKGIEGIRKPVNWGIKVCLCWHNTVSYLNKYSACYY